MAKSLPSQRRAQSAAEEIANGVSHGVGLLAAVAVSYTGVGFYAAKRIRYAHFVWHLFVIAGTACHCIAVLRYAV